MNQYKITGMSCAACQARVEKAVSSLEGVDSCTVSLLTNSLSVEGTADPKTVIRAVTEAGYGASLKVRSKDKTGYDEELKDSITPKLLMRLTASVILLVFMLIIPTAGIKLVLTIAIMIINGRFFVSGFKGAMHGSPNMDTLVALGSMASFGYSVYLIVAGAEVKELYLDSAAMILTFITVGKTLEARSKGKTTDAIKSLMKLSPKTAVLIVDGNEMECPVENVKAGDIFVVRPGESIPVDGIIIEGITSVNEAALTGESVPADKQVGSRVLTATYNLSGYIRCKATRVGQDTTLARIISMVSEAAATKAPIAKTADMVSGVFVPVVMGISLITFVIWILAGQTTEFALIRAICVLVISCPCALGLATPVAIMVGNGVAARNGVLFKTAESIEQTGKVSIVALDKTGTVTNGEMVVTDIVTNYGVSDKELIELACALEMKSEHPLGKAIVKLANENGYIVDAVSGFKASIGAGVSGEYRGINAYGGNVAFIKKHVDVPPEIEDTSNDLSSEGKTPLYFVMGERLLGLIAVADTIKEDSVAAIESLKVMGCYVVMLTGDNNRTAQYIADQVGVDEVVAEVLHQDKEAIVRQLTEYGKVAMVGDGINDAIALTKADVGIAIGAGADVAIDAADVVLMKSCLTDVVKAIKISRKTLINIHENLFWAFIYNIIGIPLAAGAYYCAFGWELEPMYAAAAMSLSSFCVVTNALRLNWINLDTYKGYKKKKSTIAEGMLIKMNRKDKHMEIAVNGMMCQHCEAHCKQALEKVDGIVLATASHENGIVVIETSKDVPEADIKAAVENAGYEYAGVK